MDSNNKQDPLAHQHLQAVEARIARLEAATVNSVMATLASNEAPLDPQWAVQKWLEIQAGRKLIKTLSNEVKRL